MVQYQRKPGQPRFPWREAQPERAVDQPRHSLGKLAERDGMSLTYDPLLTGTLPIAQGGTGQVTRQAAIDALTNASDYSPGFVLALNSATESQWRLGPSSTPSQPTITKWIDGDNIVRFMVGDDNVDVQWQQWEVYRFTLYDPTGATVKNVKTLSSKLSGSSRLRDRWVEYTAAEQTAAGYTPDPLETFWIDVIQVGDYDNSTSNKQEL